MSEKKKNYKNTLNLPKTGFSMKANLPQREPEILKKWDGSDIYDTIMKSRKDSGKTFILHDGPPYANGHIHMGHVLNKTLKDICVKYYTMKGFLTPYVPGWDCHGLPVEHQLMKELKVTKHQIDQVDFRKKAYNYAMKFVRVQAKEFKRLGIFGDWDNPYLTIGREYEAEILYALADLYEKGYIYKDLKPVNWCAGCETALAEAEVEHNDKRSPSVYVKFKTKDEVNGRPVHLVIWTTTPWTLPANAAVAVHPDLMYSFVEVGNEVWVLADELVEAVMKKAEIKDHKVLEKKKGSDVAGEIKTAVHPFIDRESVVVLAPYVTIEDGTGCVHTAPGHGQDDYVTGKKYDLPVIMPVDDSGRFTEEGGEFAGEDVVKANGAIIARMQSDGTLIKAEEITHSYPHCWRCKKPVIFRATEQWFMRIDHNALREKMKKTINNDVKWVPEGGKDRIGAMVESRPDWCLSRQRLWGVPIPAFKCDSCGETFTNAKIIRNLADRAKKEGLNIWFGENAGDILPEGSACGKCGSSKLIKENDILDVWFDSGVSHRSVLRTRAELSYPADLYLEGSDQHRGWFQSALITAMAINGNAPYREVLTHGFVVDGEGKKMSKSIGNVISPEDIMKKYGADILRLWVASSDYEGDIKLSSEILERLADGYRKIRNTFRFSLSNLYDFIPEKDTVDLEALSEIDRWMLSQLHGLLEKVTEYYEKRQFHKVYRAVYDFCVYEVSSFYLDVLKDVLYIVAPDAHKRRSAQTVIFNILNVLCRVMAPILSFTAEEVWGHIVLEGKEESVHISNWPDIEKEMAGWKNEELNEKWREILNMRGKVLKVLELKREEGLIGSSLEAAITFWSDDAGMKNLIDQNIDLFPFLFKVSQVVPAGTDISRMEDIPGMPLRIDVSKASGIKCQRCWNFSKTVGTNKDFPDLCERCYNTVFERSDNG